MICLKFKLLRPIFVAALIVGMPPVSAARAVNVARADSVRPSVREKLLGKWTMKSARRGGVDLNDNIGDGSVSFYIYQGSPSIAIEHSNGCTTAAGTVQIGNHSLRLVRQFYSAAIGCPTETAAATELGRAILKGPINFAFKDGRLLLSSANLSVVCARAR